MRQHYHSFAVVFSNIPSMTMSQIFDLIATQSWNNVTIQISIHRSSYRFALLFSCFNHIVTGAINVQIALNIAKKNGNNNKNVSILKGNILYSYSSFLFRVFSV